MSNDAVMVSAARLRRPCGGAPSYSTPGHRGFPCGKDAVVSTDQDKAREVISRFLERSGKQPEALTEDLRLYGDGLELDSLEAAELSATLEDEFGSDPFTAGGAEPQTIGDILAFYAA
jgi:acyl carrier protein